jgi:signal transduction histidine kinase
MNQDNLQTEFAPPERLSPEIVKKQVEQFLRYDLSCPALQVLINTPPGFLLVLNDKRQVIYCNDNFISFCGVQSKNEIYGKRPGELLNCIHSSMNPGGCGTTRFCRKCGAVIAIINGISGQKDIQECRIIQKDTGKAFVFRVFTSNLKSINDDFCIMAISDISHEKRRRALERIFYHDILNTINSLQGCIELLNDSKPETHENLTGLLEDLAVKIIDDINAQRELTAAENDELKVEWSELSALSILKELKEMIDKNPVAQNKRIDIDPESTNFIFISDKVLLSRVIINLLKNALEAIPEQNSIKLGCQRQNQEVVFWVQNSTYIPEEVQLQIFQRSFSTKGINRGQGTYSIRLLTERYLNGRVSFESNESFGTIFQVFLPLNINQINEEDKNHG